MGDWISIRLGEVCTKIGSGATPRGGNDVYLSSGPYALIRSQNIYNDGLRREGLAYIGEQHACELANVEVFDGDVLLNITGDSVARSCQADPCVLPARVNQHVAIIRPDPSKVDPRYLRYFLISPKVQTQLLSWAGSGGTRNALTKAMIQGLDMMAPHNVDEQRAIGHILGTLDDKIELNRRMNETLQAIAKALFKSWFIDFNPVRAKMEGRDPGLPKHLADLFPDSFEDSELGEIPKGWNVWSVAQIGPVICGKTPSTQVPGYYGDDISFITIPDMHGKVFVTKTQKRLSSAGAASQEKKTLPVGSICVSCIATPGLVVLTSEPAQTNQQINTVVPYNLDESYMWFWSLRNLGKDIQSGGSGGSVFANLSTGRFSGLHVLAPSEPLRKSYHLLVAAFFNRILSNEREAHILVSLRDSLLPKLISGELRVKDAERFVGDYI